MNLKVFSNVPADKYSENCTTKGIISWCLSTNFHQIEIPESKIKLRRVSVSSSIKHVVAASMFKASNWSTVLNPSPSPPPHGSESPQASKLLPPHAHIVRKMGLIDEPFINRCSHHL